MAKQTEGIFRAAWRSGVESVRAGGGGFEMPSRRDIISFVALIAIGAGVYYVYNMDREIVQRRAADKSAAVAAGNPSAFALAAWPANEHQTRADMPTPSMLVVRFSLDAAVTRDVARHRVFDAVVTLVPQLFSSFPALEKVTITATATFTNIAGHDHVADAAAIEFSRATAAGINFSNINPENTPVLADHAWLHPSLQRQQK